MEPSVTPSCSLAVTHVRPRGEKQEVRELSVLCPLGPHPLAKSGKHSPSTWRRDLGPGGSWAPSPPWQHTDLRGPEPPADVGMEPAAGSEALFCTSGQGRGRAEEVFVFSQLEVNLSTWHVLVILALSSPPL